MSPIARRGLCLVLAAPSGAGKTAIAQSLVETDPDLTKSISVTTRAPRPGEVDGVHYHFLSEARFAALQQSGELLEWARVLHGTHAYGTPAAPVERALSCGRDLIFDIDWQGHRSMQARLPDDVVGVFVLPPDLATLERRLRGRGSDAEAEIARRMAVARDEISHWAEFDYVVVNDDLPTTIQQVRTILQAERMRRRRTVGLAEFVHGLGV